MDFYEVLDQVIDLLKQRGRAPYRALRLQFHLEDEHLEVLKEELIDVQQLAVDQDGRMLIWTEETGEAKDHVADEPHIRWECRSSPYYQHSALYPIIDLLQRTLRWQQDDTPEQRLEKLTQHLRQYQLSLEESVPLFGALLSLPVPEDRYPPLAWTPQRQRQKTLEAIVAIILELAEQQPVLFILEDAHWLDASTRELLGLLIDQVPIASLLILITYRPEFQPTWGNLSYLTPLTLNRLSHDDIEQMIARVTDRKPLLTEIVQHLVDKTDGVPLYVEEMTKSVLESGVLKDTEGRYELTNSAPLTSLARLWRSQGKRDEARDLLAPVYGWFTEGFETADLIDAKTLLDELA